MVNGSRTSDASNTGLLVLRRVIVLTISYVYKGLECKECRGE